MKRYYISMDGGGSKTVAVLYDNELNLLGSARCAGSNSLFRPLGDVCRDLQAVMKTLLDGRDIDVESVDLCFPTTEKDMLDVIMHNFRVKKVERYSETLTALAASFRDTGIVIISGTGSNALYFENGEYVTGVGGYGPLLGDEGSGYAIGLAALKTVFCQHDGRMEKTPLYRFAMQKWDAEQNPRKIIWHFAKNPNAREEIASFAKEVTKAAEMGDPAAIAVYEAAARDLFLQLEAVAKRVTDRWDGFVTLMGGAWKGYAGFFDTFCALVKERFPQAVIQKPLFEPVVGNIVLRGQEFGIPADEMRKRLLTNFSEFIYKG